MKVDGKPLSELTDAELEAEARRRRIARGGRSGRRNAERFSTPERVLKSLKSLGLGPSASKKEVQKAYLALLDRYDPEKRKHDAKKYETAKTLTAALSEAYREVITYFETRQNLLE